MLAKSRRLRSAEVREVLSSGRPLRGGAVSAKMLPAKGALRAAAVVPKSVAKTAVVRNKLRRALYRALADFPAVPGKIVFFVRKIPDAPIAPALRREIEGIINQISKSKMNI